MKAWLCVVFAVLSSAVVSSARAQDPDTTARFAPAHPDSVQSNIARLERMAASIQSQLDGSLPEGFVVQTLFEVDLLDEVAVGRRREELQEAIARRDAELPTADSLRALEIAAINQVDRLRLQFLSRAPEERVRVNQAEKQRRELARAQEIAARERESAETRAAEAEAQRQRAIAEAQRQQSAVREDLAQEMVRAQTALSGLARLEADLAQTREGQAAHAQRIVREVWELDARLQSSPADSVVVHIFELCVQKQRVALGRLRQALTAWSSASVVPSASPDRALMDVRDSTVVEQVEAIRVAYEDIDATVTRLRQVERDGRWQALQHEAEHARILNELRIRTLDRLPSDRRRSVLRLGRAGLEQLRLEAAYVVLAARFHLASRLRNLHRVPTALRDVFTLGATFYILLRVTLVLGAALLVRRHWRSIIGATQNALLRYAHSFRDARRVRTFVSILRTAGPWALVLLTLVVLRAALDAAATWAEPFLLLRVAVWYAAYRLSVSVLHSSVVKIAMHYFPNLGSVTILALLRSLRRILGVVFSIAVLLDVSEIFLGAGYLYNLVVRLAGLVVLFTILMVLRSWRQEICDAYLRVSPSGRLAAAVKSTRELWFGFFVGWAAFVFLAGRALVAIGRDFALGFDQVRRALAFVFRRRMEKRAERRGYADAEIDELPQALVQNFLDQPVTDERLVVAHFPGLDEFEESFARWKETGAGGQFLLIGERGMGKTSWLGRVTNADGVRIDHCELDERVWTKSALVRELSARLLPDAPPITRLRDLRKTLLAGEPRLVVLDMCQNLFLGMVGGYEGLEAFSELTSETSSQVFWLCACNSHAWTHLEAVRPDLSLFQHRHALTRWSEDGIRALIETRVDASGVEVDFKELVLDRFDPVTAENRLVGAEEAYIRLLWDFCDGNPRAAMHFWLHSLEPVDERRVSVRLFRAPTSEVLEAANDVAKFILAAVVVHENLTVPEAAATTRYSRKICRLHLSRFVENEILRLEHGRYRVSTHWHRTVVRFLRRKNFLAD